jgi:ribonuclease HI
VSSSEHVIAYTDGACSRNPGPGGWGVLLIKKTTVRFISGFSPHSTNNRMELQAAIEALKALKWSSDVEIHTDSKYLQDGIQKWIHSWKIRSWRTSSNKPVLNIELWKELDELVQTNFVRWKWVRGHSTNRYNNFVDNLATTAITKREGVNRKVDLNELERLIDVRQVSRRLRPT